MTLSNACSLPLAAVLWLAAAGAALAETPPQHLHPLKLPHAAHNANVASYNRSAQAYVVPDLVLTDAKERPVRLRQLLAGKDPVMLNFIFTSCAAICPVMSRIFSEVPAQLGGEARQLHMVSISIDPENDTPRKLDAYARNYQAGADWRFLTGRSEDIKAVQRAFDNYRGDKMSHEPLTLMRAAPDQPWLRIDGFATAAQLAQEYRGMLAR